MSENVPSVSFGDIPEIYPYGEALDAKRSRMIDAMKERAPDTVFPSDEEWLVLMRRVVEAASQNDDIDHIHIPWVSTRTFCPRNHAFVCARAFHLFLSEKVN